MYTLSEIQRILGGRWLQYRRLEASIDHLVLDSRQLAHHAQALFFALPGRRHDGHAFLPDLYRAGLRHFVVSRPVEPAEFPEADILLVPDSLAALQTLAAHHRAQFALPVVGITGSNGKTIVKEWLYQLLHTDYDIVRSPKSYNSQVGVPLSVWQIQPRHTLGIFEAGISQMGEMERLAPIVRCDIGIFTNIGSAHREGFPSKQAKVAEKMRLFDSARLLIYCRDYPLIDEAARTWQAARPGRRLLAWSREGQTADLTITGIQTRAGAPTQITALWRGEGETKRLGVSIPFSDAASIENAVHCWALLLELGVSAHRVRARMRRLEPVEMRLELKAGINRCTLINDAYNNDLVSLEIALRFARQQQQAGKLTLILSDILQSGQPPERLYARVADTLRQWPVSRLIGIGADIPALENHLPPGLAAAFFPDTEHFLQNFHRFDFHDELVLLKGARPFAFERIARRLEQKAHKTVLEINLAALVHNLNVYSRLLNPGARMLVMVKASGYGSGSAQVAQLLEFHKVDYLGVAYADEGVELRQAGVQLPILVLNPEPASFDVLYRYRLEPEVYSLPMLDELLEFAGAGRSLKVHVKLDTGMHRLGFEPDDIAPLLSRLEKRPNVHIQTVFSHLAASDAPGHDAFTRRQAAAFVAMADALSEGLGYRPWRHILNTGGIARFPEYQFDMVRLGIGLYGIDASGLQDQLQVVNTLKATVSQVKHIPAGETVGYNRNGPVNRPSRIATISVGYADGLLRLAGNGRYQVQVRGRLASTIGNVCMDMTMIDVTDIPDVQAGDEVIVFGEQPPVQTLAQTLQTIPYEVFTNISERVNRVYFQE